MSKAVEGARSSKRSFVRGPTDIPLIHATIGAIFEEAIARYGANYALACPEQGVRWTYAELKRQVDSLAIGLLKLGLTSGDRIGLWCPNRAEWAVTQYAAAKLGLILVCINPAYRATEIEHALNSVGCKALVLTDRLKTSDYVALIQEVAPELAACSPGQLRAARLPTLTTVIKLGDEVVPGFFRYCDVLESGRDGDGAELVRIGAQLRPEDTVAILFTSGTTGAAKGATFNHHQLLSNGNIDGSIMEIGQSDAICVPLPLYHIFGMLTGNLIAMIFGAKVVYSGEVFSPAATLSAIEQEACTVVYGVPTIFKAMLDHPDRSSFNLSWLRTGLIAGAAVPFELCLQLIEHLHIPQLMQVYGMTEASATITIPGLYDTVERRVGTAGRAIPHVEIKLVDTGGEVVPVGSPGELCFRGFSVTQGYWNDPARTAEVIDADGWMHSGDLATVDTDGYFRIIGRTKEIIIRGGENIHPGEVELYLASHPKIQSALIVGVPDEKYGEELCACIQLKPEATLTDAEVREFCEGKIAHYKIPKYFRFVDSYPMTTTGKIQRHIVKQKSTEILRKKAKADI